MKGRATAVLVAILLAACGGQVDVTGTMQNDDEAESVWHYQGEARATVEVDSFRLEGLPVGEPIDLRFTSEDGVHARMELRDLPGGARVHLVDVWIEDGMAYPSRVELTGGEIVTVNGIRMGDPSDLPGELDERGVVLAADRSGDALLVRPVDESLPDLRVVVTPATVVVSRAGEPGSSDEVSAGDTVRVVGTTDSGYLIATEIVLPGRRP